MEELKNESGRSMVEMLGVLAIIGVLSIVGLAGYRQAMNKVIANEAVNLANQIWVQQLTASNGACAPINNKAVSSLGITEVPAIIGAAGTISVTVSCPNATTGVGGKVSLAGPNIKKVSAVVAGMNLANPAVAVLNS